MIAATASQARTQAPPQDAAGTHQQPSSRVHLTASDGLRLHCRRWLPGTTNVRASLLFLHGIASHGAWFAETAALLAEHGIAVYAPDRRGSGLSAGPRGHIPSYEQAVADAELFLDLATAELPGTPVFLAGSSWAAKMSIVLAARRQHDLNGLLLLGPGLFSRIDLTLQQKLLVLASHRFGHRRHIQIPLYPALYTRTPACIDFIHDDPHRVLAASTRFYWETRRLDWARERFAARLRLPVMVQMGAADRIADADATAAWVDRLPTLDRSSYLYARGSHTLDFEAEPLLSVYRADLLAWLDQRIGDASAWETTYAS